MSVAFFSDHVASRGRRRPRRQGSSPILSSAQVTALALLFAANANAAEPDAPAATSVESEEEIVVSGEQPGPGLWKVTNGNHVLWVFGTLSPAPRDMTWRSKQVEKVIAQAKEVIERESVSTNIGFFRAMRLMPAALRARKNADGAVLKDLLTPQVYARWTAQKLKYIGNDRGIEEWRPMFAALQLYSKALKKSGLTEGSPVMKVVIKAARQSGARRITPEVKIDLDDPKQAIRDFGETPRALDIACLVATVERLEDMSVMKQRANAWAVGDVEELKRLPFPRLETACRDALTSAPKLQEMFANVKNRVFNEWMGAVDSALKKNDVTLAVLPIEEILDPNGRLAKLQEKGYTVEWPQS